MVDCYTKERIMDFSLGGNGSSHYVFGCFFFIETNEFLFYFLALLLIYD